MNKITFDQFLHANGLPPVGEIVTTPSGFRVEVVGYVFDTMEDVVKIMSVEDPWVVTRWMFSQIRECTWEGKDETVFD